MGKTDPQKVARALVEPLTDAVCYTAKWLKSSLEKPSGNADNQGRERIESDFGSVSPGSNPGPAAPSGHGSAREEGEVSILLSRMEDPRHLTL